MKDVTLNPVPFTMTAERPADSAAEGWLTEMKGNQDAAIC